MKSFLYSIWEIIEVGLIALVAVVIIRNFLFQPFLVSGASMEPNFSSGDYLLIDEITFRFQQPQRGEVIVFRYPVDKTTFYIKRIIGLPGEKLKINSGQIMIFNNEYPDGFMLGEGYLPPNFKTNGQDEFTLKNSEYFVLGDNRSFSFDSRSWGPLAQADIIGLVRLRLWPFNKVTGLLNKIRSTKSEIRNNI